MGNIRLYGSTSGYTELAPPAVAPDGVLSLPSGVGTLLTAEGGKVLQVVSTTKTDTFSTNSASFTDITGMTVTITPTRNTSKILIFVNMMMSSDGLNNRLTPILVLRGSTAISQGNSAGSRNRISATGNNHNTSAASSVSFNFLDSPATTSATTYKVQTFGIGNTSVFVNRSAADPDNANHERGVSSITVMEVSA